MNFRQAQYSDAARIAYGLLVWDKELPEQKKMINGSIEDAYRAAEQICGGCFVTVVAEDQGEIVGTIAVKHSISLMGFQPHGNIVALFVMPKSRGQFLGLRLIRKAIEMKDQMKWNWLEMNPWADDARLEKILHRLGFVDDTHTHVLR